MASGSIVKSGATFDLLWTNPSPTSNFSAQTVSLDLSAYDAVMIVFLANTTDLDRQASMIVLKNGYQHILFMMYLSGTNFRTRYATASDTGVTFSNGYNNATAGAGNNIPYKIYGIKGIPLG